MRTVQAAPMRCSPRAPMVKFLGGDGKVLTVDSRTLLGVKEQQTLVVKGVANRDNSGNVTIAAEKIYVRR